MFWFFLSVVVAAFFSFIGVMTWLGQRKKERDGFYQSETMKKIAEAGSAAAAIEYERERDRLNRAGMRRGLQLAGLVTLAVGVGFTVFLWGIEKHEPVYLMGVVPVLVGLVLFGFGHFGVPKD